MLMSRRPDRLSGSAEFVADGAAPGRDGDRAVRVLLVGEHEIIAEGLQAILAPYRGRVEFVGQVRRTQDLARIASRLDADIVLLELSMHSRSAIDLRTDELPFRIVIFTDDADERSALEALRRGASGYLLTSLSGAHLADLLVRVYDGDVVVDPTLASRIAIRASNDGRGQVWPGRQVGLSQRESQVLGLLVDGMSNRLIAAELIVGEETVKTHLRNIYRKLEVRDRAQAVAVAIRRKII